MYFRRENFGGAWFVMVLDEARGVLLIRWCCTEVVAHVGCGAGAQAVVKAFVVSIIEALLLQTRFHGPIHLGHKSEFRMTATDGCDRIGPERNIDRSEAVVGKRTIAPRANKDVRLEKHRHIAAHAVTKFGDTM